ncbi:MAG: nuclear transport factor 2 family protein [Dehalococcoidia bacterium]|nr:nuclear transport factor 2 family protein [Dehalococcoidia bacterium]
MKADVKTEAEVMNVMSQSMEAFVKRDLDALLALYAHDPGLVVIGPYSQFKGYWPGNKFTGTAN